MQIPTPARLEAFSDGVIAVIITIMVLEIKVPQTNGWESLRQLVAPLSIYLLSFWFTGTYWLNHQHLIRRTEKADHAVQCANLLFLCLLSLLPFSTSYVVEKRITGFATTVYVVTLMLVGLSFLVLRLAVHRHLYRRGALMRDDKVGLRNHVISLLLYLFCAVSACYFPRFAVAATGFLTLLWIFPNLSHRQAFQNEGVP